LDDYLKAVDFLTINKGHKLENEITLVIDKSKRSESEIKSNLYNKEQEIKKLMDEASFNSDAIAALSDQVIKLQKEIEMLKMKK